MALDPEARAQGRVRAPPSTPSRRGRRRAAGLRREHRLRRAQRDAHRRADVRALQKNLVRSHSTGRRARPRRCPRCAAMMLLRAQVLALGHSACAWSCVDALVAMLNARRAPAHPRAGIGRRLGGSGAARPPGARDDRRRARRRLRRARSCPRPRRSQRGPRAGRARGERRARAHQRHAVHGRRSGTLALLDARASMRRRRRRRRHEPRGPEGIGRPFDERLQAARPHPGQAIVAPQPARAA